MLRGILRRANRTQTGKEASSHFIALKITWFLNCVTGITTCTAADAQENLENSRVSELVQLADTSEAKGNKPEEAQAAQTAGVHENVFWSDVVIAALLAKFGSCALLPGEVRTFEHTVQPVLLDIVLHLVSMMSVQLSSRCQQDLHELQEQNDTVVGFEFDVEDILSSDCRVRALPVMSFVGAKLMYYRSCDPSKALRYENRLPYPMLMASEYAGVLTCVFVLWTMYVYAHLFSPDIGSESLMNRFVHFVVHCERHQLTHCCFALVVWLWRGATNCMVNMQNVTITF